MTLNQRAEKIVNCFSTYWSCALIGCTKYACCIFCEMARQLQICCTKTWPFAFQIEQGKIGIGNVESFSNIIFERVQKGICIMQIIITTSPKSTSIASQNNIALGTYNYKCGIPIITLTWLTYHLFFYLVMRIELGKIITQGCIAQHPRVIIFQIYPIAHCFDLRIVEQLRVKGKREHFGMLNGKDALSRHKCHVWHGTRGTPILPTQCNGITRGKHRNAQVTHCWKKIKKFEKHTGSA